MFSEDVANWLIGHLGTIPYLVLAFAIELLAPVLLLLVFVYVLATGRGSGRACLLLGGCVAAWASLSWLMVPYCGGYPCLPGLVATMVVFGATPVDTLPQELFLHAVNFVLWPSVGWLLFRLKASLVQRTRPER